MQVQVQVQDTVKVKVKVKAEAKVTVTEKVTFGRPVATRTLLVLAHGLAHAAGLGAVPHHCTRVVQALGLPPDSALRRVLVIADRLAAYLRVAVVP